MPVRRELLTWEDVDRLIQCLLPQFEGEFDAMLMITRGGIIPGGLLAEAMNITRILTAAVDFPNEMERERTGLLAWPLFIQFPEDELIRGRRCLVVDDVWGSGRTITAVKNRVSAAGGFSSTCVLHFNPYRSLFGNLRPDYYAAITDAHIVYPWEIDRGVERVLRG
jgi:hypoxanthine phosphoribosyltransferase